MAKICQNESAVASRQRWVEDGGMLRLCCFAILAGAAMTAAQTNAPIKDLGEGRLQIGSVTLDTKLKSLTFPAAINMTTGMVEYALVTVTGKVHESLLRTET